VGEEDALGDHEVTSGNIKLMLSHVLPDIINKILKGQNPLHILGSGEQVRCYTNGLDIARGIRMAVENEKAINEDFNISTPVATSVIELAKSVWNILNPDLEFSFVSDEAYIYDVQKRIPDTSKAQELLGFKSEITIEQSILEVVEYMRGKK
jgi:nucleoside-diphosphate-sugar epimerase